MPTRRRLRQRLSALLGAATPTRTVGRTGPSAPAPATPEQPPAGDDAVAATYAPRADGEPDPGEVVWAWVPYEDDPSRGKDRPVLLLEERDGRWHGLMLSSQDHDLDVEDEARYGRHWMDVGSGGWDRSGRPSEVRLDRVVVLERAAIRREGAALDREIFERVVAEVRRHRA